MKELKKFNLSEALEGKPVITRDGREVTQLTKFENVDSHYCLIAVANTSIKLYTIEGFYYKNQVEESVNDLFMAPIKTKYYVHVVKYNGLVMSFTSTNNQLDKDVLGERLETFEFEIDE